MEQEFRLRTSQISYYIFFLLTQISYDRNPGQGLGMGMGNWYGGGRIVSVGCVIRDTTHAQYYSLVVPRSQDHI